MSPALLQTYRTTKAAKELLAPRERQVLRLIAEGQSLKQIAGALGISHKTAQSHRANIMSRLNCHCVSELVRYAIRNHIVEP